MARVFVRVEAQRQLVVRALDLARGCRRRNAERAVMLLVVDGTWAARVGTGIRVGIGARHPHELALTLQILEVERGYAPVCAQGPSASRKNIDPGLYEHGAVSAKTLPGKLSL